MANIQCSVPGLSEDTGRPPALDINYTILGVVHNPRPILCVRGHSSKTKHYFLLAVKMTMSHLDCSLSAGTDVFS